MIDKAKLEELKMDLLYVENSYEYNKSDLLRLIDKIVDLLNTLPGTY